MIKINLIAVGKVKEKYYAEAIAEYSKRLGRFCEFKIEEVNEENFAGDVTPSIIESIKEKEGDNILKKIKGKAFAFTIEGKKYSSVNFANKIKSLTDFDVGEITFIIGGSYGLSDRIKNVAEGISFSDLTFPHTLFRVMAVEQIYRAFTIINGASYHK